VTKFLTSGDGSIQQGGENHTARVARSEERERSSSQSVRARIRATQGECQSAFEVFVTTALAEESTLESGTCHKKGPGSFEPRAYTKQPSAPSRAVLNLSTKSRLLSVIPAQAGIQAVFELEPEPNLDAGFRRHDELSLRLKRGISTIPERDIKSGSVLFFHTAIR
jgi:hypothetical protein